MDDRCLDIVRISRYLRNGVDSEDALRLERHASHCSRCHEKLQSMKRHSESLFEEFRDGRVQPDGGCPSHIQLQHFLRRALSERQLAHLQQHVANCGQCLHRLATMQEDMDYVTGPRSSSLAAVDHAGAATKWTAGTRQPAPTRWRQTRTPDLDLRFLMHGLRVAGGTVQVLQQATPSLACRLDLDRELDESRSTMVAGAMLRFRVQAPARLLEGWVSVQSPEAFRLGLRQLPCGFEQPVALRLWSRERTWIEHPVWRGTWEPEQLLAPGYYFVGISEFEPPWLALAVELELPNTAQRAELAYAHCLHGRFLAAVRCLEGANHVPEMDLMLALCRSFVSQHLPLGDDAGMLWRLPAVPVELPPDPVALNVGSLRGDAVVEVAQLVQAIQRRAAFVEASRRAAHAEPPLSRLQFRHAYGVFMHRMRPLRDSVHSRLCDTSNPA